MASASPNRASALFHRASSSAATRRFSGSAASYCGGVEDPGFRYLLTAGAQRRTFVKVSAAYRNGKDGVGEATALEAYPLLRDALGLDRLVWGSDWPHTQFETVENHKKTRAFLDAMVPDAAEREAILSKNPAALFRFG